LTEYYSFTEEETIVIKIPKIEEKEKERIKEELEKLARKRIEKIKVLKKLEELAKNSKLTEEECINLGRLVKRGRYEKLKKMGLL